MNACNDTLQGGNLAMLEYKQALSTNWQSKHTVHPPGRHLISAKAMMAEGIRQCCANLRV